VGTQGPLEGFSRLGRLARICLYNEGSPSCLFDLRVKSCLLATLYFCSTNLSSVLFDYRSRLTCTHRRCSCVLGLLAIPMELGSGGLYLSSFACSSRLLSSGGWFILSSFDDPRRSDTVARSAYEPSGCTVQSGGWLVSLGSPQLPRHSRKGIRLCVLLGIVASLRLCHLLSCFFRCVDLHGRAPPVGSSWMSD
jgi:hypothetical protein